MDFDPQKLAVCLNFLSGLIKVSPAPVLYSYALLRMQLSTVHCYLGRIPTVFTKRDFSVYKLSIIL